MNTKKSFKKAFSLVELMVVIVVVGILASAGTMGLSKWQDSANLEASKVLARQVDAAKATYASTVPGAAVTFDAATTDSARWLLVRDYAGGSSESWSDFGSIGDYTVDIGTTINADSRVVNGSGSAFSAY